MNANTAKLAVQFLHRCDLKGSEVPAFMEVVGALGQIMEGPKPAPIQPVVPRVKSKPDKK